MKLTIIVLALLCGPLWAQEGKRSELSTPEQRFWEARRVMLAGDPASAAELFREVAKASDPKVGDDSLYWMGRCYLRIKDREPAAVVAFLRLIKEHPESPFLDDAARELGRMGDRTAVPLLRKRLAKQEGKSRELTAKALTELGEADALEVLAKKDKKAGKKNEIEDLRQEVARLRKEVEEAVDLVKRLVEKKAKAKAKASDK